MDYRAFEQRLLDTIFTTDVQLTPATIAYLYKLSLQEASDLMQQAAVNGLLNIESDDEGNLLYVYPNRTRLPPRDQSAGSAAAAMPAGLVRSEPPPQLYRPTGNGHAGPAAYQGYTSSGQPVPYEPSGAGGTDMLPGELTRPGMVRCPFCNEQIIAGAKKCKHCHEYLDYALRDIHVRNQVQQVSVALQPAQQQSSMVPWTGGTQAALLSVFMPGLGQMCNGRVAAGLLWMMFTIMGYFCLFVPGITLHILCVLNAYRQPRQLP